MKKYSLIQVLDISCILHQNKGTPALEQRLQGQLSLPTEDKVEASTGVGDVEVLGQSIMLQHHSYPMAVHPLLPVSQKE